jgi:tetratricopeptide (TPR) repeat protein
VKITRKVVAVLAVSLLAAACTDQSLTPEDISLNDRGVAQMGRYEYAAAHATFAETVARSPGWLDARVNLAIAAQNRQQEGDQQQAVEILSGVLEEDPGQLRALYTSAIIHLYLGEAELAAERLGKVVDADPRDAYATYFLGQAYLQTGDHDAAAKWFLHTLDLDPYLRSAYWAGAQALRRIDQDDRAFSLLDDYKRFARNPAARVAGFSYKRMGPKAEVMAVTARDAAVSPRPVGSVFAASVVVDSGDWQNTTVTTADIDKDKLPDLLLANERGLVVLAGRADGTFARVADHALANLAGESSSSGINAALWGDVNDDGEVDVVLCGDHGGHLWQQTSSHGWAATGTGTTAPCTSGALFDADHDGDLDIFLTGPDGNELLSNNRDGSFRPLAEEMGLRGQAGVQVVAADLDADRDLDILVVNERPPNSLWQNDRTWQYRSLPGLDDLRNEALLAVTVGDTDADGHAEIYAVARNGDLIVWRSDGVTWQRSILLPSATPEEVVTRAELSVADFDGDGRLELLRSSHSGFTLIDPRSGKVLSEQRVEGLASAIPVILDPGTGPAVVATGAGGVQLFPAGPGRHRFLSLMVSGQYKQAQMRSNASGIGTRVRVRTGGQWTVLDTLDSHSGPGQSLAPLSVGLAGHGGADFVSLDWSDGVSQTEVDLEAGRLHEITETQRQLASCPVVFAWDGQGYAFVSDVLGVGGLGFFDSPGVYAPPRPFEGYLLSGDQLVERDGRYQVKFSEPMEENAYLDAARIHVYDLPLGWSMVLDERMGILGPEVSGRAITYRRAADPVRATTADGEEVTALVLAEDHTAPPPGEIDKRFIGLLVEDQVVTLEFEQPLTGPGAVLVADGWIEYPYSQTVFAAWQAGLRYRAPTLEARDGEGHWRTVAVEFGYPAGMPRKMALPLPVLPAGTDALRLSSNMEVYWDKLQIVWEEPLDNALRTTLSPIVARVARTGFARRTTAAQRLPHYDYKDRAPYWDTKFQRGYYTAFGDAMELVAEADGAVAIIGGGEEIHLEFEAAPVPRPGMRRYFALDFRGWAKDMDLYTEHAETVGPLPIPEGLESAVLVRRAELHSRYNVRFQEGL